MQLVKLYFFIIAKEATNKVIMMIFTRYVEEEVGSRVTACAIARAPLAVPLRFRQKVSRRDPVLFIHNNRFVPKLTSLTFSKTCLCCEPFSTSFIRYHNGRKKPRKDYKLDPSSRMGEQWRIFDVVTVKTTPSEQPANGSAYE